MSDTYNRIPNMSWKSPVANAGALPALGNSDGDARVALDTDTIYVWHQGSSSWLAVASPGPSTAIDALNGDVSATGPGVVSATVNSVGGSSAANIHSAELAANAATNLNTPSTIAKRDASGNFRASNPINAQDVATKDYVDSHIPGDPNSVAFFDNTGVLNDDPLVGYYPSLVQTFPPFAARGFYADSDAINSDTTGFVFSSLDTSTDSFTTNLGVITGSNSAVGATNPTGGIVIGTGNVSDPGATANTGAINIFSGPNNAAGSSGGIDVSSGQTTDGPSGQVSIRTGSPGGTGASGNMVISTGGAISGNTGSLNINTGSSSGGSSGDLKISAGASDGVAFNGEAALGTAPVMAAAASADSGVVQVESGPVLDAAATGASGSVTVESGVNLGLGNSGALDFKSGDVSGSTAQSGNFSLSSGNTTDGNSGGLFLQSGSSNTGSSGNVSLSTGPSITGSGNSGTQQVSTGNVDAGNSGLVTIFTGQSTSGNSGGINIISGNAGIDSGTLNIKSGDATGNSGSIIVEPGTAGGTRGSIQFQNGSEGTPGQVWSSTDTSGSGTWLGILKDSGGTESVDWNSRILEDSSVEPSVDWGNRTLNDLNGMPVLDWNAISVLKLAAPLNCQTAPIINAGNIQLQDSKLISNQTTPPTATPNANAGTGASASVSNATDIAGKVELISGTIGLVSGAQVKVTFNSPYSVAPIVVLTPNDPSAAAGTLGVYVTSTTNGFTINFSIAAGISQTYDWFYHVIETQ